MKTVSAFSNEPGLGGGNILFGLERDETTLFPSYDVVGVDAPDQLSADLSTQCADMLNRSVRPRVETQLVDGEPVVGVEVSEAEASDKPIYLETMTYWLFSRSARARAMISRLSRVPP